LGGEKGGALEIGEKQKKKFSTEMGRMGLPRRRLGQRDVFNFTMKKWASPYFKEKKKRYPDEGFNG